MEAQGEDLQRAPRGTMSIMTVIRWRQKRLARTIARCGSGHGESSTASGDSRRRKQSPFVRLFGLSGYGMVLGYPQVNIVRLSEEHGVAESADGPLNWEIGQRVEIIPNHVCPVSNLFDQVHVIRQDRVETTWNVAARGRLQ